MTAEQKAKRKYGKKIRARTYKFLRRVKKMVGCIKCGYNEHFAALHFDHIDPSQKSSKGSAIENMWSIRRIKEELRKCQVLCANCHSIKSHNERQSK